METKNRINSQRNNSSQGEPLTTVIKALLTRNVELQQLYRQLQASNEALRQVNELLKAGNENLQRGLDKVSK